MLKRKHRILKALSFSEKLKIVNAYESGKSRNEIISEFGLSESIFYKVLRDKDTIKSQCFEGHGNKKRRRVSEFPNVEKCLLEWIIQSHDKNIPIDGPLLKEKSKDFATKLGIQKFSASNGWLGGFKKRHGIFLKRTAGESKSLWKEKKCALKRQLVPEVTEESNSELETYSLMTNLEERMAALINTEELDAQIDSDTNAPLSVSVNSEESIPFEPPVTLKEERETSPEPDDDTSCPNSPLPATPEYKPEVEDTQRDETRPVLSSPAASLSDQIQSAVELFLKQNQQTAEVAQFNVQTKKHTGTTSPINDNADSVTHANSAAQKSEESIPFVPPVTLKDERETSPEPDRDTSYPNSPLTDTPEDKPEVDDAQRDENRPVLSSSAASLSSHIQSAVELFLKQNQQIAEVAQFNVQTKKHTGTTPPINDNADSVTHANSAAQKRGRTDLPIPRKASPRENQTFPEAKEEFSSTSNPFRIIYSHPSISSTKSREDNAVAIESQSSRNRTISRSTKTNSRLIRGTRPRFLTANDRLLAIEEKHARAELLRARTARESVAAWQSISESINNLSQAVRLAGQQIADALNNKV